MRARPERPSQFHVRRPPERIREQAILKPSHTVGLLREKRSIEQEMAAKVTVEDVKRVADLAHLELAPEETPRMVEDLNAILGYVAELNELDTDGVTPLAQVSELDGAGGASELRPDVPRPSLSRTAVMPQAPETDNVFFKVPKVIER
jgi:aspartyl-tRNA(Asn)/glutamyl-tRNA(Gln) amidotransferase subunit C